MEARADRVLGLVNSGDELVEVELSVRAMFGNDVLNVVVNANHVLRGTPGPGRPVLAIDSDCVDVVNDDTRSYIYFVFLFFLLLSALVWQGAHHPHHWTKIPGRSSPLKALARACPRAPVHQPGGPRGAL